MKKSIPFTLFLILVPLMNCAISSSLDSISQSSNSISRSLNSLSASLESISGSFKSSSESLSKDNEKKEQTLYIKEVSYFTKFAIIENLSSDQYLRELNHIARNHGIVDWEINANTYIGIGKGMKISNVSSNQLQEFLRSLSNSYIKEHISYGYQQ